MKRKTLEELRLWVVKKRVGMAFEKKEKKQAFPNFACKGLVGHVADTPNETLISVIHLCSIGGKKGREAGREAGREGGRQGDYQCLCESVLCVVARLDPGGR